MSISLVIWNFCCILLQSVIFRDQSAVIKVISMSDVHQWWVLEDFMLGGTADSLIY